METDSFFYQLLKKLPETLFALLGQPLSRAADYRFDALEDLLASPRVRRIYLEELSTPGGAPPGLAILQLATSSENKTIELVSRLVRQVRREPDCDRAEVMLQMTEEVLIRRYRQLDREEIRSMFKLHDLRKTRVW